MSPSRPLPLLSCLSALSLAATILACTGAHEQARTGAAAYEDPQGEGWRQALEGATREAKVYNQLQTALILRGTLMTPAVQEAYGWELSRRMVLSPEQRTERLVDLLSQIQGKVRVVFALSVPSQTHIHLDRPTTEGWALHLYDGGGRSVAPLQITRISGKTAPERSVFSYVTLWDELYVVDFPAEAAGSALLAPGTTLTFQVAGIPGAAELSWPIDAALLRTQVVLPPPPAAASEGPVSSL